MRNTDKFTNRAEAYAKGRPGYPREAVEKILSFAPPGAVFADIGAGTGKFAKDIAEQGFRLYAVEPNGDMRAQLAVTLEPYSNAEIVAGTAEATTLPEHSVDIITVAHALHWFDPEAFRAECLRIIKPGSWIFAIYNHVPGREADDFCRRAVDAFFSGPEIWMFDNPVCHTRDSWLAYIASQDDSPLPGDPGYAAHIAALNEIFDRDSVDGLLRCDRITGVYGGNYVSASQGIT
ncbi:MAG: class I SAM-dependent methyltransferase [Lachnospiraceae bacterium]|nr:class I SAM-dependent methyltransferase [Lachnospiraceae bacterium]